MELFNLKRLDQLIAWDKLQNTKPQWFAIADAAVDKRLPAILKTGQSDSCCLFGSPDDSDVAKAAPHLVAIPRYFEHSVWQWINDYGSRQGRVTLIATYLDFDSLFAHLQAFLDVELEGGLDMTLAFWDSNILATLVGQSDDTTLFVKDTVFDAEQRQAFLAPLVGWFYWNRDNELHHIKGGNNPIGYNCDVLPLKLTQQQENLLIEATLPDQILFYLRENNPVLLNKIKPKDQYRFVCEQLPVARRVGLETFKDIVNFMCIALTYGDTMYTDPVIKALFKGIATKEFTLDDAIEALPS